MSERRDNFRARCDFPVTWRRGRKSVAMRAIDFSGRGLFLLTDADVPLSFVMDLVIELPTGRVEVFGVARHISTTKLGRGVGISLMAMSDEESERWWGFYRGAMSASHRPVVTLRLAA